jgi:NAD(P)-dependent dehydrogenase (short-subunit alcohol dehydrogenase family)
MLQDLLRSHPPARRSLSISHALEPCFERWTSSETLELPLEIFLHGLAITRRTGRELVADGLRNVANGYLNPHEVNMPALTAKCSRLDDLPDGSYAGRMATLDVSSVPDYPALLRLDARGFVVVGAGQGIGRQTAHALARSGARVVCVDTERDRADAVAGEVGGTAWVGDVRERDAVERLVAEAGRTLGRVDGLVDIVGEARFAPFLDCTDEDWEWSFGMALRHAYLSAQIAGRAMVERGGVMVFVASVSGLTSAPRHAAYGAAKAALMSLVRTVAVELGPSGVRVNAVAPGTIWTPRVAALLGEEGRARNVANAPLRRVGLPADVASAILFLASDLSSYVTGQTLVVDGGVSAKFPYPSGA